MCDELAACCGDLMDQIDGGGGGENDFLIAFERCSEEDISQGCGVGGLIEDPKKSGKDMQVEFAEKVVENGCVLIVFWVVLLMIDAVGAHRLPNRVGLHIVAWVK